MGSGTGTAVTAQGQQSQLRGQQSQLTALAAAARLSRLLGTIFSVISEVPPRRLELLSSRGAADEAG